MNKELITRFEANKGQLRSIFAKAHPSSYTEIVKAVVQVLTTEDYADMDPERIHVIDDGDYQGTLVYVIAAMGYQPNAYWYVYVGYGSCSGCDTLQAIHGYSDDPPTSAQVDDYMGLALNVVQGLRKMYEDEGE